MVGGVIPQWDCLRSDGVVCDVVRNTACSMHQLFASLRAPRWFQLELLLGSVSRVSVSVRPYLQDLGDPRVDVVKCALSSP